MITKLFAQTDIGKVRKNNEDTALAKCYPFYTLLMVCDGIGGHKKGEIASMMCLTKITNMLSETNFAALTNHTKIVKQLKNIISETNTKIYSLNFNNEKYKGLGTTLTLALILENNTYIVNVGDSRAYVLDYDGSFTQLTKDDNIYNYIVEKGLISSDLSSTMDKFALTQAVGLKDNIAPTVYRIENSYKKLLLCTDGLYNMVNLDQIGYIVSSKEMSTKEKVETLINKANDNGGKDNIGVALLELD